MLLFSSLICHVKDVTQYIQLWYADDSCAVGLLSFVGDWYDKLVFLSPLFGYFLEPSKRHLTVSPMLIMLNHCFVILVLMLLLDGILVHGTKHASFHQKCNIVARVLLPEIVSEEDVRKEITSVLKFFQLCHQ